MEVTFRPAKMQDAAEAFLGIPGHVSLELRLIAVLNTPQTGTPSVDFVEPTDPFYAVQTITYNQWVFSTDATAVRALGPTCVFAFQGGLEIAGYWLHVAGAPDDWVLKVIYSSGAHVIDTNGGAEIITPALQWFPQDQVA